MSANWIAASVLYSARRPFRVILLASLLGIMCAWLAMTRLAVSTDVDELFSPALPWKQREAELKRLFPQFKDLLVAVIDSESPEIAEDTAAGLQAALARDPHFLTSRRPDASPFYERNGMLFLEPRVLERLLDQTIDAQPFLGQLAADPTIRGLFSALSMVGVGVERGQADLGALSDQLIAFDAALRGAAAGNPKPLSWQRLLAGPASDLGGPHRFVLAQPRLDYGALQPGAAATAAMRAMAAKQEFVQSGMATVRITGAVALADEEFATAAHGAVVGLIGSTLIVVLWLGFAVRTWRLVLPILLTLILGLLFTTGFGLLTSNPLNLISVAFAILFVGIAVDFSIQFAVRYREFAVRILDPVAALEAAARRAGRQILIAAMATAAGFLAFVPTDFTGVAELGLIAGIGMLIAMACTLSILPASIMLFMPRQMTTPQEVGFVWAAPIDRLIMHMRRGLLAMFAALAILAVLTIPRLVFDSDPLHTKNPGTEAMRTLRDLASNPFTSPYSIDILVRDAAAAHDAAGQVRSLPLVGQALTLESFVPADQASKLALIADAASLLGPTLARRGVVPPATPDDIRLAARTAHAQLARALPRLPSNHPLASIAETIQRLETAPDDVLVAANTALTRFLPRQLDRLRLALEAQPVDSAAIPPDISRDWVLPDGRRRVQVSGKAENGGAESLRRFVDQVRQQTPDAGGAAVTIVETANTIIRAFVHAALGAFLAIVVILVLSLRRLPDVLMVLAPLLLSGLITLLAIALLPLPLNFANVIALPLLLGVGVSFNIYFVMNWREGERRPLASPTARAVVFSALTTGTAFGSLALSSHPGTASMGVLLLLSLASTLIASLVFVPAMLATFPPHGDGTTR